MSTSTQNRTFPRLFEKAPPDGQRAFVEFLVVVASADGQVAPTEAEDELLHALIEDRERLDRVEAILGCFIVHNPGLSGASLEEAFARSNATRHRVFAHTASGSAAICGAEAAICGAEAAICGAEAAICGAEAAICGAEAAMCGASANRIGPVHSPSALVAELSFALRASV